jgi:flagellar biosynthesis/type III secretory pathway protein FliH
MKDLQKLFIVLTLALIAVGGAAAQNRDRDRDRNDRDRNEQRAERWRVRHSGRNYDLDRSQADMLRQAVNAGYQQGYQAGREGRTARRRGVSYRTNTAYREGTYGYNSGVDRNLYQYYFQQGFQRGWQDGYNSRFHYGRNENGSVNILGNIVESILGLRRY